MGRSLDRSQRATRRVRGVFTDPSGKRMKPSAAGWASVLRPSSPVDPESGDPADRQLAEGSALFPTDPATRRLYGVNPNSGDNYTVVRDPIGYKVVKLIDFRALLPIYG